MGFFNRKRRNKQALRTSSTYTQERMTQDHLASTALFYAATGHTHVDPEAQREDAREDTQNYDLTDDNDTPVTQDTESDDVAPEPEPTPEPATEQNVTDTDYYTPSEPASSYDSGSSYSSSYDSSSSYSSSYDSGSSSSYDSGGSFDSGSY